MRLYRGEPPGIFIERCGGVAAGWVASAGGCKPAFSEAASHWRSDFAWTVIASARRSRERCFRHLDSGRGRPGEATRTMARSEGDRVHSKGRAVPEERLDCRFGGEKRIVRSRRR